MTNKISDYMKTMLKELQTSTVCALIQPTIMPWRNFFSQVITGLLPHNSL